MLLLIPKMGRERGGQRPFGLFPKKHPLLKRHTSLTLDKYTWVQICFWRRLHGWNLFWFKCTTDYINWHVAAWPAGWLMCTLPPLLLCPSQLQLHNVVFVAFVNFSNLFPTFLIFLHLSFAFGHLFCSSLYFPTFLNVCAVPAANPVTRVSDMIVGGPPIKG